MLMLVFHAGEETFACPCDYISEIIPQVEIKPIHHMPDFIRGSINVGGKPIPVIDWCSLMLERTCRPTLHTRIILFQFPGDGQEFEFGLMAEKVTKTIDVPLERFVEGRIAVKDFPYMGGIMTEGNQSIQFIKTDKLLDSIKNYVCEIT
jgi:chemotaxis-related protein WspB